jgi:sterol O-acyltransferase
MNKEVIHIEQSLKSAMVLLQELKETDEKQPLLEGEKRGKDEGQIKKDLLLMYQREIVERKKKMIEELHTAIGEFEENYDKVAGEVMKQIENEEEHQKNMGRNIFAQKVHKIRTSLLVRMYQNKDARTVYHIFIAVMLIQIIQEMLLSYYDSKVLIDLSLFTYVFGDIFMVAIFWLGMASYSFLIIPIVKLIHSYQLQPIAWVPIYSLFQCVIYIVPCVFCLYRKTPIACGFIVTCEMVRLSLKTHSYLREKLLFGNGPNDYATFIPEALKRKGVTLDSLSIPNIQIRDYPTECERFLYFFFAPTLIYRDSYPRTSSSRRFSLILVNLLNCLGTIFYVFIIFQGHCLPYFQESWKESYNARFVLTSWFRSMIPGTMLLVLMFFGMLHSWFNLWAEILRFGDREFYTDWWNVTNFADYYRKWNIVVHEWLFHYIYQDMLRFTKGKASQIQGFFAVFLISALIHELILAISMQFFYPILLVMFGGPGVIYTFFSRKEAGFLNVFVWSMFFIGNSLLVVFYSWEYFARKGLDLSCTYGWKSFFIPHSWGIV